MNIRLRNKSINFIVKKKFRFRVGWSYPELTLIIIKNLEFKLLINLGS